MEYGIVIPPGVARVRSGIPKILGDPENDLSEWLRDLVQGQYHRVIDEAIKDFLKRLEMIEKQDEASMRLRTNASREAVTPLWRHASSALDYILLELENPGSVK